MENQSSSQIIHELNSEDINDNSSVARVVTALVASFAMLSFVFILWYAYTEGKRDGMANFRQNTSKQISNNTSGGTVNNASGTTIAGSTNQNNNPNGFAQNQGDNTKNLFPDQSFGNDFSQQKQNNNGILPRDPTQPIALSSPNKYKVESNVPPPPSLIQDNQALAKNSAQNTSGENIENIKQVAVKSQDLSASSGNSSSVSQNSVINDSSKVSHADSNLNSNNTPTPTFSKKNNYGYIVGGDFADQWRIQLASLRSLDKANGFWNARKDEFPGLLSGLKLQVEKVLINRNNKKEDFFRVKAGPFLSRNEATRACSGLKERNIDCLIVKPS